MIELLLDPNAWLAFLTLTALELVLGIDNIIFISILVERLPKAQQRTARRLGLAMAMVMRLGLLLLLSWIFGLTQPLFTAINQDTSHTSHTLESVTVDGEEVELDDAEPIERNCSLVADIQSELDLIEEPEVGCIQHVATSLDNPGFAYGGVVPVEFVFDTGAITIDATVSAPVLESGVENREVGEGAVQEGARAAGVVALGVRSRRPSCACPAYEHGKRPCLLPPRCSGRAGRGLGEEARRRRPDIRRMAGCSPHATG